jgi:formylglycine-generating enzyme required for sulfatase activity
MPELKGTTRDLVPLVSLNRTNVLDLSRPGGPAKAITNTFGMKFVLIPAGRFAMGSPEGEGLDNEHPQHQVEITRPFLLGTTEVTQHQFEQVMGHNPSQFQGTDHPVERVSFDDTIDYCRRLARHEGLPETSYRLPTEAEWEYAARLGESPSDRPESLDSSAWFKDNAGHRTHPVGQKTPNSLGLHDMAGNVAEWCSDWFGTYSIGPQRDPLGPDQPGPEGKRVLRGGNWLSKIRGCRPVDRDGAEPQIRLGLYGFRVVKVALAPRE